MSIDNLLAKIVADLNFERDEVDVNLGVASRLFGSPSKDFKDYIHELGVSKYNLEPLKQWLIRNNYDEFIEKYIVPYEQEILLDPFEQFKKKLCRAVPEVIWKNLAMDLKIDRSKLPLEIIDKVCTKYTKSNLSDLQLLIMKYLEKENVSIGIRMGILAAFNSEIAKITIPEDYTGPVQCIYCSKNIPNCVYQCGHCISCVKCYNEKIRDKVGTRCPRCGDASGKIIVLKWDY